MFLYQYFCESLPKKLIDNLMRLNMPALGANRVEITVGIVCDLYIYVTCPLRQVGFERIRQPHARPQDRGVQGGPSCTQPVNHCVSKGVPTRDLCFCLFLLSKKSLWFPVSI